MSKLLEGLRAAAMTLLDPNYSAKQAEAEYLRTVYRDNSSVVIRRNQWYRLLNETGSLVGFEWSCVCGTSYQLLDANLWMRSGPCPVCKTEMNLLKAVGATDVPPAKWPELFAQLPVRPRLAGKQESRHVDTWSEKSGGASGDVSYEPYDYKGV